MVFLGTDHRRQVAVVGGLTLLGVALRFATLDRQSFWSDEALTALLARMDFTHMVMTVSETESTPPVYYVLVWAWAKAFGYGEFGLRSLSALAGSATVPVTYLAATTLVGRRAGVAAAGLVAVSPPLLWYSQEARSYALAVLFCAASFAAFARALDRPTSRSLALWATASVLAVGTHYFATFVVGAELIWLVASRRCGAVLRAAAAVIVGAVALLPLALEQRGNGFAEYIGTAGGGLVDRVVVLVKQFLVGPALPADRAVAGVVALLLVASLVPLATRTSTGARRAARVSATIGGAAIAVPVALAAVGLDYLNTRNALVGFVPLAVAASSGLTLAAPRALGAVALLMVGCILLTVVVAVDPSYHRPDWRGFARDVGAPAVPRILVVAPDHQGWFARVPLQIYMPEARAIDDGFVLALPQFAQVSRRARDHASPRLVAVREVVVAAVGWELPTLPRPLPSSFTAVEERVAHGYRFVRYRSEQAVVLPTATLRAPLSAILLEQPVLP